ncbi:hypothetical protein L6164_000303 [Bauhinia variegata]|uniref:Uncharacterized protein n=1 Tax=Bauhinia variegata TaxID=167791 RepID=A0ACB9QBS0_BAUVA|nr:hypothetical protein L6164_000303 [Bauhinia variegata]
MEEEKKQRQPHCLVLFFPAQGHINPMFQFSKRLKQKGVRVTLQVGCSRDPQGLCGQLLASRAKNFGHGSVGCFVTHCGWNSTLEALSLGVPMVAVPQWTDQTTNAKFVADFWKMGVKPETDEKGIVRRETMKKCIKEVMETEREREMKRNAIKWKGLAKRAFEEGGSSEKHLEEFVKHLLSSANA